MRKNHGHFCKSQDTPSHSNITSYFQHTGCGISSRLGGLSLENGLLENREILSEMNDPSLIKDTIAQAHGPDVDCMIIFYLLHRSQCISRTLSHRLNCPVQQIDLDGGDGYTRPIEVIIFTPLQKQVIEVNEFIILIYLFLI